MITPAEVGKLAAVHTVRPGVLSLYLAVAPDAAGLSGLPARAEDLIAAAERAAAGRGHVAAKDRAWVLEKLETGARDCLGRTMAMFACADAGLSEAFPAPGHPADLAVLGIRPHVRPLLAALQRYPGDPAATAVDRLAEERAERLAKRLAAMRPGGLAAAGLRACLTAVNACAAQTLIVPDDRLVPGYECGRCGDLSVDADGCPDWGVAALPVPDVIEEMVARTLEDGGEVWPVHGGLSRIAALLRFPVGQ